MPNSMRNDMMPEEMKPMTRGDRVAIAVFLLAMGGIFVWMFFAATA